MGQLELGEVEAGIAKMRGAKAARTVTRIEPHQIGWFATSPHLVLRFTVDVKSVGNVRYLI